MFKLDQRLADDTIEIASLALSRVLLMRDARYPWIILVPQRPGLVEIGDLPREDRLQLSDETDLAAQALTRLYDPDKINIGALGNVVSQLHVHIVARTVGDPAWPGPVWGHSPAETYAPEMLKRRLDEIATALS